MHWIYNGIKDSILIQSLLLYWSIYGIYNAVIKSSNYNNVLFYSILNRKDKKVIKFWYCGKYNFHLVNPLNITLKISDSINKVIIFSDNILNDMLIKDNKLFVIKKELLTDDVIQIELYGEDQASDNILEYSDVSKFDLHEKNRFSLIIAMCYYIIFIIFFLTCIGSLIGSFVNVKWDTYYLLDTKAKQIGFDLGYEFEDIYSQIYDTNDNIDKCHFQIKDFLMENYGYNLPLSIFTEIEKDILGKRIQKFLECICVLVILIYIITRYFKNVMPRKIIGNEKYFFQLKGERIFCAKYKNIE